MKKKLQVLISMLVLASMVLVAFVPVAAQEAAPPPASLDAGYAALLGSMVGYNTVKAEGLLVEMASDAPPFLLDVRTTAELEEGGHIEGAVHIPLNELAQHLDLLPAFDTPIVAYCGSGWRATIAMTVLEGMGWTEVRALKATYLDWVAAGNPVADGVPEAVALNAAEPNADVVAAVDAALAAYGVKPFGVVDAEGLNTALVEDPEMILIDVRRTDEWVSKGVVDTGDAALVQIPLERFAAQMANWPADKDAHIVVYCGSGHRSTMAMAILWSYGYTNVSSLKGGFGGWADGGYAVAEYVGADLDGAYGKMIADMAGYYALKDMAALNESLGSDSPPFLLDVRQPAELEETGHIEGAVNIPLSDLALHLDLLPSFDTPIVVYCKAGWRAAIGMTALHALGWTDVVALHSPSYTGWVEAEYPIVEGLAPEPMVLNAAEPDAAMVALIDEMLANIPAGWGSINADDLAVEIVENPDLLLIDVRTADEVEESVIDAPNLSWVMLDDFINLKDQWPTDLDAPIVVYCKAGHRSTVAMIIMRSYGYTNIRSLSGGFTGWVGAEYPVAEYVAP